MEHNIKKRKDIKVYVYCHKEVPYGIENDSLRTPLEVGAACRDTHVADAIRDDSIEDNVSLMNPVYAELCGLYYIWKTVDDTTKWVGGYQYRRLLNLPEDIKLKDLKGFKAICCKRLKLGATVEKQFINCHSKKYIDSFHDVTLQLYPEYAEDWNKYIKNSNELYYSNGFILRTPDFKNYCSWLFNIINTWMTANGFKTAEDIQTSVREDIKAGVTPNTNTNRNYFYSGQIPVFMSERLFTLWVRHNFEGKIMEIPYTLMEQSGI